jgi:hypothetical protein
VEVYEERFTPINVVAARKLPLCLRAVCVLCVRCVCAVCALCVRCVCAVFAQTAVLVFSTAVYAQ